MARRKPPEPTAPRTSEAPAQVGPDMPAELAGTRTGLSPAPQVPDKRDRKQEPLYVVKKDPKKRFREILVAASIAVSVLLLVPAFLLYAGTGLFGLPKQAWLHFLVLGILAAIGPYGFYAAHESRRIKLLEERFPDFLRDVASSHRGGLTLANSVGIAARGEYGPLTAEVRTMADQLSWNVSFEEALVRFADRVETPLVRRAVNLILQANRSGGSTTEVLLAAARDAREIKTLETERRLTMSLYTVVIYVTFAVFLAVAAIMYAQFVPQLVASQEAVSESALGDVPGLSADKLSLEDYQLFYFMAAIMQGLGDGVVAGLMGTGRAVLGLRHSFLMVVLAYVTFLFLL